MNSSRNNQINDRSYNTVPNTQRGAAAIFKFPSPSASYAEPDKTKAAAGIDHGIQTMSVSLAYWATLRQCASAGQQRETQG